jgi:hypothetical protein
LSFSDDRVRTGSAAIGGLSTVNMLIVCSLFILLFRRRRCRMANVSGLVVESMIAGISFCRHSIDQAETVRVRIEYRSVQISRSLATFEGCLSAVCILAAKTKPSVTSSWNPHDVGSIRFICFRVRTRVAEPAFVMQVDLSVMLISLGANLHIHGNVGKTDYGR